MCSPETFSGLEEFVLKSDYVIRQPQTREHHCHWPGCSRQVPPAMWGCGPHWRRLPQEIRTSLWEAYRPGQERDLSPSRAYLDAARAAQDWIEGHQGEEPAEEQLSFGFDFGEGDGHASK